MLSVGSSFSRAALASTAGTVIGSAPSLAVLASSGFWRELKQG